MRLHQQNLMMMLFNLWLKENQRFTHTCYEMSPCQRILLITLLQNFGKKNHSSKCCGSMHAMKYRKPLIFCGLYISQINGKVQFCTKYVRKTVRRNRVGAGTFNTHNSPAASWNNSRIRLLCFKHQDNWQWCRIYSNIYKTRWNITS